MGSDNLFFYLMVEKGFVVLDRFVGRFGPSAVEGVMTNRDPGTNPDYIDDITEFFRAGDIPAFRRNDNVSIGSQYAISISWRWLIDSGSSRLIVLHDSLLPRYRGFNPLVFCLINGEPEIGVTAFFASEKYDQGPVLAQTRTPITQPIAIQTANSKIAPLYADLVERLYESVQAGRELVATPQNEADAAYSLWRDDREYQIDWTRDPEYLQRFVLAVGPPQAGANTDLAEEGVRIYRVESLPDVVIENRTPS